MQRGIAHASKSVLAGLATFAATSAVIVTFAVNQVNPPREVASNDAPAPTYTAPSSTAAPEPEPTADAGVGTEEESSDEPTATGAQAPAASESSEDSPEVGVDLRVPTSVLDPALLSLLGRDVPETLEELLPPAKDLPVRELIK